jgi:HAD superfamily hydrolase (TIGR01509 family)
MVKKLVPPGRPIRCILFDLGYTLWDRRRNAELWQQAERASNGRTLALLRQGVPAELLPSHDDQVLGERLLEAFDEQEHEMIRRHPGREPDGVQCVVQALHAWGLPVVDPTLAASMFEALNVRIPDSMPLLEDTLPTLAALRQRGFLLGVVTNRLWGGEAFREDLRALGLLDYFDPRAIAVSADLLVRKPHPALFQRALEALTLAPEEAAMVGDSLRTDILGAKPLGIFTVWLPRAKQRQHIEEYVAVSGALPAPRQEPAARGASTEPQADERLSDDVNFFDEDYLPANVQGKDGYLERYFRGEIAPDVIIERVSDLLDIFV